MRITNETKHYLNNLASKANMLANAKYQALKFVEKNDVFDEHVVTSCLIMAMMWVSGVSGWEITEQDLFDHLGIDDVPDEKTVTKLDDVLLSLSLTEVLALVIEDA